MKYISTRGKAPTLSFEQVATSGLASDGGLYVPETYPTIPLDEIKSWKGLSYEEIAFNVMKPFIQDSVPDEDLKNLIAKSYKPFRAKETAPLVQLEKDHYILELFHGPTLAFKDFALQFLGNLLDYLLDKTGEDVVIIGATSGDTGSAAIEGCLGCEHIKLFMLHPYNRVSDVQRKQMTTVAAPNIFNLAVGAPTHGNFDDCQDMVKHMFRHPDFMGDTKLTAVNSINWVRIMAQIVYYFHAVLSLDAFDKPASFSVPTGNFGDIFAGYIAKKMGLPIGKLIVATNENDILDRFFKANDYSKQGVKPTTSPSMDIQISSNFERLLFDLYDNDDTAIRELMDGFSEDGSMVVTDNVLEAAKAQFGSHATNDARTKALIKDVYEACEYVMDPHTATGVGASRHYVDKYSPIVTLSTAHPAKFPAVAEESLGFTPELPSHLKDLFDREETMHEVPNDLNTVKAFIAEYS